LNCDVGNEILDTVAAGSAGEEKTGSETALFREFFCNAACYG